MSPTKRFWSTPNGNGDASLTSLLDLDDPRWGDLEHAHGPAGNVPSVLRAIEAEPGPTTSDSPRDMRENPTPWEIIYTMILHSGTVYDSAYATVPHLVRIGNVRPELRGEIFQALGIALTPGSACSCPTWLQESWKQALACARRWPPVLEGSGYSLVGSLRGFMGLRHPTLREDVDPNHPIRRNFVAALSQLAGGEVEGECPSCRKYLLVVFEAGRMELSDGSRPAATWEIDGFAPEVDDLLAMQEPAWPAEQNGAVAFALAERAGDSSLANALAGMATTVACVHCGARSTPAAMVEADGSCRDKPE